MKSTEAISSLLVVLIIVVVAGIGAAAYYSAIQPRGPMGTSTPDFDISVADSSISISPGSSGSVTITVTSQNGFDSGVSLSIDALPTGVNASFDPSSVTPPANGSVSSVLTLTVGSTATPTTRSHRLTVTGTSGSLSHSATISLTVTAPEVQEPVFELPIANIDEVTGVQAFHDPRSSELHVGFDFELPNPTEIYSPIDGTVTDVHKFQMSNGYWIVDVNIQINSEWSMFIAFEPWTTDESVIDGQLSKIVVKKGDKVKQGQPLGVLDTVPNSEFPHIHWSVQRNGEYVSPYDYCSESARAEMDILCDRFGVQPSY